MLKCFPNLPVGELHKTYWEVICLLSSETRVLSSCGTLLDPHSPLCQDVSWAAHVRKTGRPTGNACELCAAICRKTWPLKSWEQILLEKQTTAGFQEVYERAKRVHLGEQEADFLQQECRSEKWAGYWVERLWTFVPVKSFEADHGCTPTSLGLPVDTIIVDQKPEKGVLMLKSDEITVRSVDAVSASLHETLFNGGQQVRADQGAEVYKAWTSDAASRPKAFSKTDLTVAQVAEKARLAKEKRAAEAERAKQLHANLPEKPAEPEVQEPVAPDEEEEEEVVQKSGLTAPLLLPSARIPSNKRKPREQSCLSSTEPRKRMKGKTSVATISMPAPSSVAGSLRHDGATTAAASSVGTGVSGKEPKVKLSPDEKSLQKAKEWMDTLVLEKILAGLGQKGQSSHGRELWQASQTLEALEHNENLRGSVESVLLAAHVEIGYVAEETLVQRVVSSTA